MKISKQSTKPKLDITDEGTLKKLKEIQDFYYNPEEFCPEEYCECESGVHSYKRISGTSYKEASDWYEVTISITEGRVTTDSCGTDLGAWDDYKSRYDEVLKISKDFQEIRLVTKEEIPMYYAEYIEFDSDGDADFTGEFSNLYETIAELKCEIEKAMKENGYCDYIIKETNFEKEKFLTLSLSGIPQEQDLVKDER